MAEGGHERSVTGLFVTDIGSEAFWTYTRFWGSFLTVGICGTLICGSNKVLKQTETGKMIFLSDHIAINWAFSADKTIKNEVLSVGIAVKW